MGLFKEFIAEWNNGLTSKFYQKHSTGKYFIYSLEGIIIFSDKDSCIQYLKDNTL
jgi:hypothetical protein